MSKQTMSRAGRQSHAAHPQTNLILQYDDWQVKKTFLELLIPKKKCQIKGSLSSFGV